MRRQTTTINWSSQLPLAQGIRFDSEPQPPIAARLAREPRGDAASRCPGAGDTRSRVLSSWAYSDTRIFLDPRAELLERGQPAQLRRRPPCRAPRRASTRRFPAGSAAIRRRARKSRCQRRSSALDSAAAGAASRRSAVREIGGAEQRARCARVSCRHLGWAPRARILEQPAHAARLGEPARDCGSRARARRAAGAAASTAASNGVRARAADRLGEARAAEASAAIASVSARRADRRRPPAAARIRADALGEVAHLTRRARYARDARRPPRWPVAASAAVHSKRTSTRSRIRASAGNTATVPLRQSSARLAAARRARSGARATGYARPARSSSSARARRRHAGAASAQIAPLRDFAALLDHRDLRHRVRRDLRRIEAQLPREWRATHAASAEAAELAAAGPRATMNRLGGRLRDRDRAAARLLRQRPQQRLDARPRIPGNRRIDRRARQFRQREERHAQASRRRPVRRARSGSRPASTSRRRRPAPETRASTAASGRRAKISLVPSLKRRTTRRARGAG